MKHLLKKLIYKEEDKKKIRCSLDSKVRENRDKTSSKLEELRKK